MIGGTPDEAVLGKEPAIEHAVSSFIGIGIGIGFDFFRHAYFNVGHLLANR